VPYTVVATARGDEVRVSGGAGRNALVITLS
jgi:hypothetical protein